jgi:Zn-ribbon RNA-binding protein
MCGSCKKKVVNEKGSVTFLCPKCSNFEVVRCDNCRRNAIKYTCPQCEFVGPN